MKALAIREKVLGVEHPDIASSYNTIGFVYGSQGDYHNALEGDLKSYKILRRVFGGTHPTTILVKDDMKAAYRKAALRKPFDRWLQRQLED
jgi:preprotein translocase subunit SecA/nephrocystin-3